MSAISVKFYVVATNVSHLHWISSLFFPGLVIPNFERRYIMMVGLDDLGSLVQP